MRLLLPRWEEDPDLDALYAHPPGVRLGFVSSLDGAVTAGGSSRPLSGPADGLVLRTLRRAADVVLVGAGTARAEGYRAVRVPEDHRARRRARGQADDPVLAVVTRTGDVPVPGALVLAPAAAGVPGALAVGDAVVDLGQALAALRARGLERVLCEGGPELAGALLAAGLVDEVCATVSPVLAGGVAPRMLTGAPESLRPLRLVHLLEGDGALLGRWAVERAAG